MRKLSFPGKNGIETIETDKRVIIFIGANGAGKSKLGAEIEKQDKMNIHRIGGQRSLNFEKNLVVKGYEVSEKKVFMGSESENNKDWYRWQSSPTTKLLNDFNDVLTALVGLNNKKEHEFYSECKCAEAKGLGHPKAPFTPIDILKEIWDEIFPQRQIILDDLSFKAEFVNGINGRKTIYSATEMSDGERAVLYLIAQVLCIPEGKTLIIDEPEVHLHKSIMHVLWRELEKHRSDCFFIYITHDIQFASSHADADKYWVKQFDGEKWDIDKIDNTEFPEELLMEIFGARKNVLFVEGERTSLDCRVYSLLFPDFHIVPCGSCATVVIRTKAFRDLSNIHHIRAYGVIDRDFRSEYEISKYQEYGIVVANIAEIENLFFTEEILRMVGKCYKFSNIDEEIASIKNKIFEEFNNDIEDQVSRKVATEINYRLQNCTVEKISIENAENFSNKIVEKFSAAEIKKVTDTVSKEYCNIKNSLDFDQLLMKYNNKNLVYKFETIFGIKNKFYFSNTLRLLQSEKARNISLVRSKYFNKLSEIMK